ncbi:MAG: hypothetical protein MUP30_08250 [Deltaproteobacteria bacterium]|nr:hypothetical protein [Deltaproteobacteria bacterium]
MDDNAGALTVDGAVTVTGTVTAVADGSAQAACTITNANPDENSVGANHACKAVLVRAHTINTGLVWVNFQAAAADLLCYPLAAGDAICVPLGNVNLVNCLFKVGGEKVTVIYTN